MSSVERMRILGVRSFGPDEEDEQTIEFAKPLSLIVGPNGSGKTTVIECLKYALIGKEPPNSDHGQSFVFDPKIAGRNEVKAAIKLVFRDERGSPMYVSRNFRVQVKQGGKLEFKALDGVLKRKSRETHEDVSQTLKGADLTDVVPHYMGVSKAILDNVVFCHQENSNWPLEESSKLKEKFDDIFESKGYAKALDEVHKLLKDTREQSRTHKADLDVLEQHLNRFKEYTNDLETAQNEVADMQAKKAASDDDLGKLRAEEKEKADFIQKNKGALGEIKTIDLLIQEAEAEVQNEKSHLEQSTLSAIKGESVESVGKRIKACGENILEQSPGLEKEMENEKRLIEENQTNQQEFSKKTEERAQLRAKKETFDVQVTSFEGMVRTLAKKYDISGSPAMSSSRQTHPVVEAMKNNRDQNEQLYNQSQEELKRLQQENEKERSSIAKQKMQIETKIESHEAREKILLKDQQKHNAILRTSGGDEEKGLEAKIQNQRDIIADTNHELDALKGEKPSASSDESDQRRAADLANEIRDYEGQLQKMQKNQEVYIRVESKFADLQTRSETFTEKLSECLKTLQQVFPTPEAANIQKKLASIEHEQREDRDSVTMTANTDKTQEVSVTTIDDDDDDGGAKVGQKRKRGLTSLLLRRVKQRVDEKSSSSSTSLSDSSSHFITSLQKAILELRKQVDEEIRRRGKASEQAEAEANKVGIQLGSLEGELKACSVALEEFRTKKEKLERSLPKAEFLDVLAEHGGDIDAARSHLEKDLREKENKERHLVGTGEFLKLQARRCAKDHACPTCSQSVASLKYSLKETAHIQVKDFDRRFVPGEYAGEDALILRLIEKIKEVESSTSKEQAEARRTEAEGALSKFQRHISTAVSLKATEKQISEKIESEKVLEERKRNLQKENSTAIAKRNELRSLKERLLKTIPSLDEVGRTVTDLQQLEKACETDLDTIDLAKFGSASSQESGMFESINTKLGKLREEKAALDKKREKMISSEMERNKKISSLNDKIGKAQTIIQQLEEGNKKRLDARQKLKEIKEELESIHEKVVTLKAELDPLNEQLTKLDRDFREKKERLEKENAFLKKRFDESSNDFRELERIWVNLKKSSATSSSSAAFKWSGADELSQVEKEHERLQREITDFNKRLDEIRGNIKRLQTQLEKSKNEKLQFERAKRFLELQGRLEERKADKRKLEERIQNFDPNSFRDVERELASLQKRLSEVTKSTMMIEGKLQEKRKNIAVYQQRLKDKELNDVESRHRSKSIDFETSKAAETDLTNYYKAMDAALMEFHQTKIREINERIRELWQLTYRGGDIDGIELRSEAKDSGKSRTYQYMLMMRRGDAEMEMRGRCSAGQKVLASLIIRLALSETFGANCGILALDEPTTNLDAENREGLAEALAKIVQSRTGRNFQLIVITHDEDFVDVLKESGIDSLEFVNKISREERNGRFFSTIEKARLT